MGKSAWTGRWFSQALKWMVTNAIPQPTRNNFATQAAGLNPIISLVTTLCDAGTHTDCMPHMIRYYPV